MRGIGRLQDILCMNVFKIVVDYAYSKKHRRKITKKERERRYFRHLTRLEEAYNKRDRLVMNTINIVHSYKEEIIKFIAMIQDIGHKFYSFKNAMINNVRKHYSGRDKTYEEKLQEYNLYCFNNNLNLKNEILKFYNKYDGIHYNTYKFMGYSCKLQVKINKIDDIHFSFLLSLYCKYGLYKYKDIKKNNKIRKYSKREITSLSKIINFKINSN